MKTVGVTLVFVFCIAFSLNAQLNWTKYSNDPVIPFNFDIGVKEIYDPCVLIDNGIYKMWYTHKINDDNQKIAYATSTDGISWTLVDTAVLVSPTKTITRFDYSGLGQGSVIKDGDTLKMWYWGNGPDIGNIGLAWSMNGRSWTRVDGPNSDLSVFNRAADGSGALAIVTPCVVKVGSTYHMWYTRLAVSGSSYLYTIAYATSPNGIQWTNVPGTGTAGAVLDLGAAGNFDENLVAYPTVLPTASGFEMWYSGRDNSQASRIGYATSTDGIHWTKITGSAPQGSVLDMAGTSSVIKDGSSYKLWYVYYNTDIFYATSSGSSGVSLNETVPMSFQLHQNYPNPFNPSTIISYTLGIKGYTTLRVYDLLGREVAALVNEIQPAGIHQTTFDAHDLSSGMYFYKLTSGNFSQIKKMSLLK